MISARQGGEIRSTRFTLLTFLPISMIEVPIKVLGLVDHPQFLYHLAAYYASSIDCHHAEKEDSIMTEELSTELLHHEVILSGGEFVQTEVVLDETGAGATVGHSEEPEGNAGNGYHSTQEEPIPKEDVDSFV